MAGPTKMIIITSNQDIIQQFSLNKAADTHIIHVEDDQPVPTTSNDIVNMTLLAELSAFNPKNDHVYKRALDSPDYSQSKSIKLAKKSDDLICSICGDRAIGYNYNALSCASCKSFFYRNAHQNIEKLRCFTGQGQCPVSYEIRRKCCKCRLNRCFAMGMRKDFILSEEDKQQRKERLEENRNISSKQSSPTEESINLSQSIDEIDQLMMDMNEDEDEDWRTIDNLRSSFRSICENDISSYAACDASDHASALIFWSQVTKQTVLGFINFFRQIDEFENLHADDRFILIKYNLFPIFPISKCYYYNPIYHSCSHGGNIEAIRFQRFYSLLFEPNDIRDIFTNLVVSLVNLTEQDPALLSLLLANLIFSQGLSTNIDEPALKDPLGVYQAQMHYTKLLWNYLVNKQGEINACKQLTQLLTIILRMQLAAKMFRDYFRSHLSSANTVEKIEPLMQTVMHIS